MTAKINFTIIIAYLLLIYIVVPPVNLLSQENSGTFDIKSYSVQIEPDIMNRSISGKVSIRFIPLKDTLRLMELDCGNLIIDSVSCPGEHIQFRTNDNKLHVNFIKPIIANQEQSILVVYHGSPVSGLKFFPEKQQTYTVFSTSHWMVCNDQPDDKAALELTIILPDSLIGIANGFMESRQKLNGNRTAYHWKQDFPIPTYIYGFAAGKFNVFSENSGRTKLQYFAEDLSENEVKKVFQYTPEMVKFFEMRSGISYADSAYTQVMAEGNVAQEMNSFTVMGKEYAKDILSDKDDLWLIAHELSHQWWGNMVTCIDWKHFWLNEGMATFMVAAFKEVQFGKEEYLKEIEKIRQRYQKIADAGKDKPLVFPDWLHPTREDRTIVYSKGAYVIHLLKEELGDELFWRGIMDYTKKYFGKSVTTEEFQAAMEKSSGRDLSQFFSKWVYMK